MKSYKALAHYYDAEYEGADILQLDVPFFLSRLPRRNLDILEIAVGTARAAIPIAQAGHRVVGVDFDPAVIDIAKQKRDGIGVDPGALKLITQNALKLKVAGRFDAAAVFFNTFLNFTTTEQQDKLLTNIRSHLKPSGRLWLDMFHPNIELLATPHAEHLEQGTFHVDALDRTVSRETEITHDVSRQLQHITYHYRWQDAKGRERHETNSFDLTYMFPRELKILLERNGFDVTAMFGDYDASPIDDDSPRMIVAAKVQRT